MTSSSVEQFAIGFDIGGTKIEGAVISSLGRVLRSERVATPNDYDGNKHAILELIAKLKGRENLLGVGFGIPGSVNPKTGILRNAPNSPAINDTPFFTELKHDVDLPVRYENDANCLILSEVRYGAAKGAADAVGIILGTGVGSGVVLGGKIYSGINGLAPELGHSILDVNGRQCLCGNKGCVEAYLSGPSILKRYKDAGGDLGIMRTEDIFTRPDDPAAIKTVRETLYLFTRVMAEIVSLYDPQVIVLGGGLSLQKSFYECGDEIARHIFGSREAPQIVSAKNGDASGKLGAASLFFL